MASLVVENAWVEFPVQRTRHSTQGLARTGGEIDFKRNVITALRDLSFEVKEGERLGLIGHNGAGKTTMLRLLAGAYAPTRGRVISVGRISTLFSTTPGLKPDGTGQENIVNCGLHLGMSRREISQKMDEIVSFSELGNYIDLPVRIYSTGMMTRLGFSIATAVEPEILLVDEGLATGDAQFAKKARTRMMEMMTRSSILILASHSEALVQNICNRCLLLEHGMVVADGSTKALMDSYRNMVAEAAANSEDEEELFKAYTVSMQIHKSGQPVPPALEEQGLRYALRIHPDDPDMLTRYMKLLKVQDKPISLELELRVILANDKVHRNRRRQWTRLQEITSDPSFENVHKSLYDEAKKLVERIQ